MAGNDKARARRLMKFFRISLDEALAVRDYQERHGGLCLLLADEGKRESFDHRHADGLLRGWLACMLNRAYGIIERLYPDNTGDVLRALADYHDNPPAQRLLGPRFGIMGRAIYKKKMLYGPPNEHKVARKSKKKSQQE